MFFIKGRLLNASKPQKVIPLKSPPSQERLSLPLESQVKSRIVEASVGVFLRFGFRKASMDAVAQAAQISRQGLYLHFSNKETLFRAMVHFVLEGGLNAATLALSGQGSIETRIAGAFDAWVGRMAGAVGADLTELYEVCSQLLGPIIPETEQRFLGVLTQAIRKSELFSAIKAIGISAQHFAETLLATSRGLKHECASPEEFHRRMGIALKILCRKEC
jgi:AcrR family transcriptional regulator